MGRTIAYVGVPTSLGSYSPGQEKAPQAFRDAGFPKMLRQEGLTVVDYGDLSVRRWRPDRKSPLGAALGDSHCLRPRDLCSFIGSSE